MKRDPNGKGFSALGRDGVLRTFDAEYNILDAQGLSPRQIKSFLDAGPYDAEAEKQFRGVDGRKVTGEEGLFRPDPSILPKKPTPEEKAARRKKVEEHNRKLREAGGPVCVPGPASNHDLGIDGEDRDGGV
ncbi:hypothetical protein NKR19_g1304 [Coniochaeta hoffmannii]|uniref:Uncharacterized protein n=1 Tax=Coniochaeta hoffmannii TaxID=91930 RepID=A0AA38W045_9PEZI|nr:hypothetical protein NKR19_g1304 [Coniochaeta hoffmannii]